jgi:hypothetical protein
MSVEDKFDNAQDKVAGKAKEVEGKVTGDKSREAQGKHRDFLVRRKTSYLMLPKPLRILLKMQLMPSKMAWKS